jgi:hypothetical protein
MTTATTSFSQELNNQAFVNWVLRHVSTVPESINKLRQDLNTDPGMVKLYITKRLSLWVAWATANDLKSVDLTDQAEIVADIMQTFERHYKRSQ